MYNFFPSNCIIYYFLGILIGGLAPPKIRNWFPQIERDKRDFRAVSRLEGAERAFAVVALLVRKLSVGSSGRTARGNPIRLKKLVSTRRVAGSAQNKLITRTS